MRTLTAFALLLAVAPLAACQSSKAPEEPTKTAGLEVLPNIPLPPGGTPITSQSGSEAMQVVSVTEVSVDSVVAYYREVLGRAPFRLINEAAADGATTFYAEQDGPSLWITVKKNGQSGAMVVIAGAVADTAAANRAKAAAQVSDAPPPVKKKPN